MPPGGIESHHRSRRERLRHSLQSVKALLRWSLVVSGPVQAATPPLSLCRIHPVSRRPFLDVVRWCPVMSVTLNLAPMSLVVLIGKCRSLTASSEQGWCCLERTKRKKIWKNSLHGPRNNNTSFHDPQKLNLPYLALILTSIPSMPCRQNLSVNSREQ